jgi:hypothetical protein
MAPPEPAEIVLAEELRLVKFSLPPIVEADRGRYNDASIAFNNRGRALDDDSSRTAVDDGHGQCPCGSDGPCGGKIFYNRLSVGFHACPRCCVEFLPPTRECGHLVSSQWATPFASVE